LSVRVRLKRMGSKKRPFYRLIAADSRMPRDGRFIETLGFYDPLTDPATVKVDEDSLFKWFARGATPTVSAESLLKQLGFMQKWHLMKQGVTGDDLANRVAAIKAQRETAVAQRGQKKKGLPSAKAQAKAKEAADQGEAATEAKPATDDAGKEAAAEAKPATDDASKEAFAQPAVSGDAEATSDAPDKNADTEASEDSGKS